MRADEDFLRKKLVVLSDLVEQNLRDLQRITDLQSSN